ncbi:MAG: CPBP family intramembrane metalloprotease [Bacteroidales bacterium]|nr:CPBP family intramembrane metalloprotease [Bacteroidales bacterium]
MKENFKKTIIVIAAFLIAMYGKSILLYFFDFKITISSKSLQIIYFYAWWVIPIVIALILIYGFLNIIKELKLNQSFTKGMLWASVMVIPMYIGSFITGKFVSGITATELIHGSLLAGFFEEIFFRGFLFGQLFRKLKWGFIPAVMLSAVIFAMGHLYQGNSTGETIGVFIVTLLGGAWFAWLFIEWNENLWVPIGLHVLMNLSWILFEISDTALGGISANIFRATTITISILITIRYAKKNGGLKINRKNLIINHN